MWLEIFRTGEHTDSSGRTESYSADDLQKIADDYNSKTEDHPQIKAPLVKGHPQTNDPAHGWVERLARRGDKLLAKVGELSKELTQDINSGRFRRISVSYFPNKLLRHIGLLGAAHPALKELPEVNFSDEKDFLNYELHEFRKAELHIPADELARLRNENAELKDKLVALERNARNKEFRDFADSLVNVQGGSAILPAEVDGLVEILELADEFDKMENAEFSAVDRVKEFFSKRKPALELNELDIKPPISKPENGNYRSDRLDLHNRAKEIEAGNESMSYEDALEIAMNY